MKREVPAGHVVRFTHYRYVEESDAATDVLPERVIRQNGLVRSPHGGMTEAHVFVGKPEGPNLVAEGVSYCSELDNYNRKIGREIALGRALKGMEQRAQIEGLVAGGMSREDAEKLVLGEEAEHAA